MGIKKYFKNELQVSMFGLEHDIAPDFYLGCWQINRSCVPLLCLRGILCAGSVAIVIASMVILQEVLAGFGFWWIYLTHWGVVANALTTIFAFGLSLRVYYTGPIDATFGLPWYVKAYWFLYNASTPMALLITIFYWAFISGQVDFYSIDNTLDIFLHAINSVVMMALLLTARQPSRLLHFHHALIFGILYLAFNVIYYFSGGTDSSGNTWVYPMVDWSLPGQTSLVALGVAVLLIVLHILVVLMSLCRDYCGKRYRMEDRSFSISQ